jgi:hypothetical protein
MVALFLLGWLSGWCFFCVSMILWAQEHTPLNAALNFLSFGAMVVCVCVSVVSGINLWQSLDIGDSHDEMH